MNEIEKMYENAGIIKHLAYFECHRGRSSIHKCPIYYDEMDEGCFYCSCENNMKEVYEYPPFTAEKQIKLIKWLSDTDYYIHNIYKTIDTKEYCIENYYYDIQTDKFEKALAGLLNKLWQDLTEEEKQQVKGILE